MAITIKDLAAETGLCVGTISAYLNGKDIRTENKEKISKAIIKTGYIRNENARVLKAHSSKTIGVLIPELSSNFATAIISFTEDELRKYGYGMIVCDCRSDKELEERAISSLVSKTVDGLIVMPTAEDGSIFDLPKSRGIPVVVIDRYIEDKEVSTVLIDNRDVSRKAVENMIAKGRKNIAVIHGGMNVYTSRERFAGYKEAMEANGLSTEGRAVDGKYTIEGGYIAMKKLLRENSGLDGVFVINYDMTLGAMFALKEWGRSPYGELMFSGFDLGDLIKVIDQKVQIVDQPLREIGINAARLIIESIERKSSENIILKASITNNFEKE